MKIHNIKEAKELAHIYETLTLTDLFDVKNKHAKNVSIRHPLEIITGFGYIHTCKLCKKVMMKNHDQPDCDKCIYSLDKKEGNLTSYCLNNIDYHQIHNIVCKHKWSVCNFTLLKLLKQRAVYIRKLIVIAEYENALETIPTLRKYKKGTEKYKEKQRLVKLVVNYEKKHYPYGEDNFEEWFDNKTKDE